MSADPVLDLHQVAAQLSTSDKRCPYERVRGHVKRGELRAVKRGRHWYVRQSWVDAFLDPDHEIPTAHSA